LCDLREIRKHFCLIHSEKETCQRHAIDQL